MSLASSASPWMSDEPPKKRQPTMNKNKTLKKTTAFAQNMSSTTNEPSEYVATESTYRDFKMPMSMSASENDDAQDVRQQRITELVQQMHSRQIDNDGHNLADFKPLDHPIVNLKKPEIISGDAPTYMPTHPIYNNSQQQQQPFTSSASSSLYSASNSDQYPKNDYHQVYQSPPPVSYTGNGGGRMTYGGSNGNDPKLLDKINYMIHLLEDQKNEKTNHTLEEFVMFTLVGVFIIYVLDSFSRSGRYVR